LTDTVGGSAADTEQSWLLRVAEIIRSQALEVHEFIHLLAKYIETDGQPLTSSTNIVLRVPFVLDRLTTEEYNSGKELGENIEPFPAIKSNRVFVGNPSSSETVSFRKFDCFSCESCREGDFSKCVRVAQCGSLEEFGWNKTENDEKKKEAKEKKRKDAELRRENLLEERKAKRVKREELRAEKSRLNAEMKIARKKKSDKKAAERQKNKKRRMK